VLWCEAHTWTFSLPAIPSSPAKPACSWLTLETMQEMHNLLQGCGGAYLPDGGGDEFACNRDGAKQDGQIALGVRRVFALLVYDPTNKRLWVGPSDVIVLRVLMRHIVMRACLLSQLAAGGCQRSIH